MYKNGIEFKPVRYWLPVFNKWYKKKFGFEIESHDLHALFNAYRIRWDKFPLKNNVMVKMYAVGAVEYMMRYMPKMEEHLYNLCEYGNIRGVDAYKAYINNTDNDETLLRYNDDENNMEKHSNFLINKMNHE